MSSCSKWPFSAAGPQAPRAGRCFLLRKGALALLMSIGLVLPAFGQRNDARPSRAAPADKVFHETLRATLWVGVTRRSESGHQTTMCTGTILDAENRLALTQASHVVGEGCKITVMGPAFDDGELANESGHYKAGLDKGTGIAAEVVSSDAKKDLAIIQLANLPSGARALPLARGVGRAGQTVMAVCTSFSTSEMWWRAPGVILRGNPLSWQSSVPFRDTPQQFEADVQLCQFAPWPKLSGGPLVNERGEFVGMYWGSVAQTGFLAIDVSEVRALLRHPDVKTILSGSDSKQEKLHGAAPPTRSPRGTPAPSKPLRPTAKQAAVLRLVGRPLAITVQYREQPDIDLNNLRVEDFTKTLTELEQRGMEYVGVLAARSAGTVQGRFLDVSVRGTLDVPRMREILGPEESLAKETYEFQGPNESQPAVKPISWYKYGWLQFGVADEVVGVVRVDCQPADSDAARDEPPTPAVTQPAAEKPRTWTSGTYTTQATLVAVEGPNVTLRKTDGNEVTIRRDLLSKEDQEYVRNSPLSRDQ